MNEDFYEIQDDGKAGRFALLIDDEPFTHISVSDVQTDRESSICEAPVETGIKSQDHIVSNPAFVTVVGDVACGSVSNLVANLNWYRQIGKLFTVITPDDCYERLAIKKMHTANVVDKYDLTSVTLTLQEILFVNGDEANTPANPEDSAPSKGGISNAS